MGARGIIAALIALVHLALIGALLFLTARSASTLPPANPVMTLIEVAGKTETIAVEPPGMVSSSFPLALEPAPVLESEPREPINMPAQTDWHTSATDIAATVIADEEARERRAAQIGRGKIDAATLARPAPEKGPHFSWSKKTEHDPSFIRVTERCGFALNILLVMPVCQIGEIKVDGELFRDMNAQPRMGGWSEDSRSGDVSMSERAGATVPPLPPSAPAGNP